MKLKVYFRSVVPLVLLGSPWAILPPAHAADWPQFRGLNRDGCATETGLKKQWPEAGLSPVWTADGLGEGYAAAAIAGGTVYVTGMNKEDAQGRLFAFDLEGKRRWAAPYGKEWDGAHPGTRYTPTIWDGRAYLLTGHGVAVCLDAGTGDVLWRRDVAGDFGGTAPVMGFAESLLVDGGRVICTPGGADASVVALDTENGETVWTSTGLSDQSAYCSPILVERGGTRLIVTLVAATLVALDPETGAIVWRVPFDETEEMQNHSVAPVYQDGLLYATSGHRKGGKLYGLSADGRRIEEKWSDETLNTLHGGLVIHDGYVYGSTSGARWACLSLADGSVTYEERGVGKGSIAYADGHFYCYGEKGMLALVNAVPDGYEIAGEFKVEQGEGNHWAHPAISDGRLYIRHGDVLIAYDIRNGG